MFRAFSEPFVEVINSAKEPEIPLDQIIEEMDRIFGERIADPSHQPRIFKAQFELARHVRRIKAKTSPALVEQNENNFHSKDDKEDVVAKTDSQPDNQEKNSKTC